MERSGYIAPVQSGGIGVEFDPPESLLYNEPEQHLLLGKCILGRAQKQGRDYVTDGAKEIFGTWQDAFIRRLFLLHTICKCDSKRQETLEKSSGTKSDINGEEFQGSAEVDDTYEIFSETLEAQSSNSCPSRSSTGFMKLNSSSNNELRANDSTSIEQFIPKIPAPVDDLVQYWRFGWPTSLGNPVKNYVSAEFRKKNVPRYSDGKWRSGQRQLLQRIKKLMKILPHFHILRFLEHFVTKHQMKHGKQQSKILNPNRSVHH